MTTQQIRAYVVLSCKEVFDETREKSLRRLRVLRKSGFDESKSVEARSLKLFIEQLDHFHRSWIDQAWNAAHNEAIVMKCSSMSDAEQRYTETLHVTIGGMLENLSARNTPDWQRRVLMTMGEFEGQACLRVDRLVVRFAKTLRERLSRPEALQPGPATPRMRPMSA